MDLGLSPTTETPVPPTPTASSKLSKDRRGLVRNWDDANFYCADFILTAIDYVLSRSLLCGRK